MNVNLTNIKSMADMLDLLEAVDASGKKGAALSNNSLPQEELAKLAEEVEENMCEQDKEDAVTLMAYIVSLIASDEEVVIMREQFEDE